MGAFLQHRQCGAVSGAFGRRVSVCFFTAEHATVAPVTKLFEHAVEAARALPPEMQDELASVILQLTGAEQPAYELSAEELASLQKSRDQAARREFVSDEQVRALWAKHGL